jgi:hypothetical protein
MAMRRYTPEELAEVLAAHSSGSRADLCGADLGGANLGGANLHGANLHGANLRGANLRGADLCSADLCSADLCSADLCSADLCSADLCSANLCSANLRGANLRGADLCSADLCSANLCDANLRGANLRDAKNADLAIAMVSHIPPEGPFCGWKKCHSTNGDIIVKLLIPAEARRSHSTERKCRAEFVDVLEVIGAAEGVSDHDRNVHYRAGERVTADSWDPNRWNTCSHGIHFFVTKEEAEAYSL